MRGLGYLVNTTCVQVPLVEATDASLEGYGYIVHSKEQFRYG